MSRRVEKHYNFFVWYYSSNSFKWAKIGKKWPYFWLWLLSAYFAYFERFRAIISNNKWIFYLYYKLVVLKKKPEVSPVPVCTVLLFSMQWYGCSLKSRLWENNITFFFLKTLKDSNIFVHRSNLILKACYIKSFWDKCSICDVILIIDGHSIILSRYI